MKNNVPRKIINVDKPNLMPLWTLKQGDDVILKLALFKENTPFNITGQTIKLGAKTQKGLKEQIDGFTIKENELDIALKNTILVPGIVEIDLEFKDAGGKMTSTSFFINVNSKVLNDVAVQATNEFDTFKRTVEEVEKDYQGLRKIIINENNAANLQDQVNKVNSSLEQKANEVDLKVERERINNIVALPPTVDNVETVDIRVGADGVTYESAGESVRSQISDLRKENINPKYEIHPNYYIGSLNKTGDTITTDTTSRWAEIDVNGIKAVTFNGTKDYGYVFYDNSINKISYGYNLTWGKTTVEVPANARFFRFSFSESTEQKVVVTSSVDAITQIKQEKSISSLILSESLSKNVFSVNDKLVQDVEGISYWKDAIGYYSTDFINIDKVKMIEFEGLYASDYHNGYEPIHFFDINYKLVRIVKPNYTSDRPSSGYIYIPVDSNVKFAIFGTQDKNNARMKFYVDNYEDKEYRNKVYVGAYYFAGWSETDFPNIHVTKDIMNTYKSRKPVWGWIEHGSFKGVSDLVTPSIQVGSGQSSLIITNTCLFNKEGQCSIYILDSDGYHKVNAVLPSNTNPDMTNTTIDISSYAGKTIKVVFRLKTRPSEISAIWTINKVKVVSNGVAVYEKDYTNHSNFDCEITDDDIWKPATETLGYTGTNGYVGCTYDQKDTSIIDKQIILAKSKGIDYFILDWYYHDDRGDFNLDAIAKEDNHIALNAFVNSAQKLDFKYIIMVSNHAGFEIIGLERWKRVFKYLSDTYFKDPSYLIVNNKPVINIYNNADIYVYYNEIEQYCIDELGWSGLVWQLNGANTAYNSIPGQAGSVSIARDFWEIVLENKTKNENMWRNSRPIMYPYLTCGWDSRPWANRPSGFARPRDWYSRNPVQWKAFFEWGYIFAKYKVNSEFKSVVICAFNEYGEGSYLAPTIGDPQASYLTAIKEVVDDMKN